MRLQLTLLPLTPQPAVPANYQYYLSSAIYHLLALASPEYATFLHEAGYQSASSERRLKMFTFSRLDIPAVRFAGGKLIAGNRQPWRLQIASLKVINVKASQYFFYDGAFSLEIAPS